MNSNNKHRLLALTLTALPALPALGVDFFWDVAGPADWHDPANWDTGTVPGGGAGNHARINNGGTAVLNADIADLQDIFVGSGGGTVGTLNQTGGTTQLPATQNGWTFVGQAGGTGTYNLSGGVNTKERVYIGDGGGSTGTLNVSGTGLISPLVSAGEVNIGVGGASGNFSVTDDGRIETGLFQLSNGTGSISGNGSIDASGEFWVGQGGGQTASVSMSSGSIESDSWVAIGRDGSTGTLTLSGDASLNKTGDTQSFITLGGLGAGGGGTLNIQDNATLTSVSNLIIAETPGRNGVVNQSGGTVTVVDNTIHGITASVAVDAGGSGLGEYNLSGGTLNAETIEVGAGTFNHTGGVLNVTTFNGALNAGGTISPGNSPGNTVINGDLNLLAGGDILIGLNGLTPETEHDQVDVVGTVNLVGSLNLAFGFTPALGDTFLVLDNDGVDAITGTFAEGLTASDGQIEVAIDYAGGDGNDIVLTVTNVIPEPSTSLLGLGALFALIGRRRRA